MLRHNHLHIPILVQQGFQLYLKGNLFCMTTYEASLFLTIGIQTYNRAEKLKRLLEQFCSLNSYLEVKKWNIEILISDNCSIDSTPLVVAGAFNKLVYSGYLVSSFRQKSNLGLDGNSLFVIENAKGKYLWFFSDDDILIPENLESLLEDIKKFEPGVCLSNFIQPPYTEDKTIFLVKDTENKKILVEPIESIKALKKYAKLTNYIIKRDFLLDSTCLKQFNLIVEKCSRQFYLFIGFSILAYFFSGNILIRKESIARCDDDYLSLEYSPQVFENLNTTVKQSLVALEQEKYVRSLTREERFYNRLRTSMKYLILHYEGKINLSDTLAMEEEAFVRKAPLWLCLHPLCVLPYVKLNLILFLKSINKY